MITYIVQPGDTLAAIAKRFYGDATQYRLIVAANDIKVPALLKVGTVLDIPGADERKYAAAGEPGQTTRIVIAGDQLQKIIPQASLENIVTYLPILNEEMPNAAIDTPLRAAHFIAQVAHESGSLHFTAENLNYSARGLRVAFDKYFPSPELAEVYGRKPEKIANRVYANRMGNGPEESGDGWKFRGRGLIQLTGRDNYHRCGKDLGLDLENKPDQVADNPEVSVKVARWYWKTKDLNRYADADDLRGITRRINGGLNGLEARKQFLQRAKGELC